MKHIKMILAALLANMIPKRVIAMALVKYSKNPSTQTVEELFAELAP